MASAQAHAESIARNAGVHAASVPRRLSTELSELLREVHDVTAYARRTALEAVQSGGTGYEEALGLLFDGWMQSTSRRRQIVSFASAAELGVPLWHHRERCKEFVDEAGLLCWRALFWVASRRMSQAERPRVTVPAARPAAVKAIVARTPCADCRQLLLDPCRWRPHAGMQALEGDVHKHVSAHLSISCAKFRCVRCGEAWLRRSGGQPFSSWTRIVGSGHGSNACAI